MKTVALVGNPNTGKSTLFNELTGLKQHVGNWPGKTVTHAEGEFIYQDERYRLVDLPGTYSLFANSADEEVTRDFLFIHRPEAVLVVVDATSMQRNLNLVLQVLEMTDRVVVAVNLMDEAKKRGITVNVVALAKQLGVPVIPIVARDRVGFDLLLAALQKVSAPNWSANVYVVKYEADVEAKIARLQQRVEQLVPHLNISSRWLAIRLLNGEYHLLEQIVPTAMKKEGEWHGVEVRSGTTNG